MAEIIANEGGGKKKGKRRAKKHSTHIDMTPMVDLTCLLLTFFMLTTAFSKPKVMEIVLPDKDQKIKDQQKIPKWRTLNIILDENDRVFWYNGIADPTKPPIPTLEESDYSKDGMRKLLLHRNKILFKDIEDLNNKVLKGKLSIKRDSLNKMIKELGKEDKIGPIVLIKATDKAKYKNMVDIIDEMAITRVARYSIVDINPFEKKLLNKKKGISNKAEKPQ
jgi:biopolymer transport protein ExbD